MKIRISPIRHEKTLEDIFINRFGKELYLTFFKDYTEKVWGISCNNISPQWGVQRIKGLSITKTLIDAISRKIINDISVNQKNTETSLITQFMYPKFGPGQMWEEVARIIKEKGGELYLKQKVIGIKHQNNKIIEVETQDSLTGIKKNHKGEFVFSTMPVQDFIAAFAEEVPPEVKKVAQGLMYRDFITVGLLLKKLKLKNETKIKTINNIVPDNWIYIQERDVRIGRLQLFNNWSPYMVKDENTVWIGLEYFCNEGDALWSKTDQDFSHFAIGELVKINIIEQADVLDSVVIRVPKTYPAYFGSYDRFQMIRNFTDQFENLFLIGRNGMHRYNNQDHSMLAAMTAVENIIKGSPSKENIWNINIDESYHEEKQ
jgi:protoporphyrinogen oxidase